MSEYEKWSLILTGLGQALVVGSIIYAARSFSLSKSDNERKIKIETLEYINEIDQSLREAYEHITKVFGYPQHTISFEQTTDEFKKEPELQISVHRILNSFEQIARDIELYDEELVIERLKGKQRIWLMFKPLIEHRRMTYSSKAWVKAEAIFDRIEKSYNN